MHSHSHDITLQLDNEKGVSNEGTMDRTGTLLIGSGYKL